MKKKILSGVFALALLATAGFGVHKSMKSNVGLSDLALANVEALAQNEGGNENGDKWQVGEKTITTEIYETTSPGWSWNASLKAWILNGTVTQTWPPQYQKTTTSVKINCCRLMGDLTNCNYEPW
jgi:hypothetical protein